MLTLRISGLFFVLLSLAGCATETLTPTFPTSSGLKQPDRVLVHEFAVTSGDSAGIVGSGLDRRAAQTEEEIHVGRALAKALSENLVTELHSRGINASSASQAAAPGDATVSIRGQFQSTGRGEEKLAGFTLRGKELRTHIRILQGSGLDLRVVGEAEYTTQTSLEPGISSAALATAVSADAKRAAQAIAERVAVYYRKYGWLK